MTPKNALRTSACIGVYTTVRMQAGLALGNMSKHLKKPSQVVTRNDTIQILSATQMLLYPGVRNEETKRGQGRTRRATSDGC